MTAYGDSLAVFDVRKPSIILNEACYASPNGKNEEEINDFDVTKTVTGQTLLSTCDDSGLAHVFAIEPDHSLTLQ